MFLETLIASLWIGGFFGFVICMVLVADPLRRDRAELRRRMIAWQLRTYAAESRAATRKALADNDRHSRKAPDLRIVQ